MSNTSPTHFHIHSQPHKHEGFSTILSSIKCLCLQVPGNNGGSLTVTSEGAFTFTGSNLFRLTLRKGHMCRLTRLTVPEIFFSYQISQKLIYIARKIERISLGFDPTGSLSEFRKLFLPKQFSNAKTLSLAVKWLPQDSEKPSRLIPNNLFTK